VNEDDVARRRESSRDLPAFSFSYANYSIAPVFLYLRRINQINYRIQWSQQAMTVPKEGDLASLAARFENHLKLSSPETSRTRRVPAQPGQPVTADDVEYVCT
jgi:hypothetical protein